MLKQLIAMLLASVICIYFQPYVKVLFIGLSHGYTLLNNVLSGVFATTAYGQLIQHTLALLFIPILITGFVSLIYALIKQKPFLQYAYVLWGAWLVLISLFSLH